MTLQTLAPSGKPEARKAEGKTLKNSGAAGTFQGILTKEMDASRPGKGAGAAQDPRMASRLPTVKDDGKPSSLLRPRNDVPADQLAEKIKQPKTEAPAAEVLAAGKKKAPGTGPMEREAGELQAEAAAASLNQALLASAGAPAIQTSVAESALPGKKVSADGVKTLTSLASESMEAAGERTETGGRKKKFSPLGDPAAPSPAETARLIQVVDRRTVQAKERAAEPTSGEVNGINNHNSSVQTGNPQKGQEEITIQYTSVQGFSTEGSGSRIQAPVTRLAADGLYRQLQDKANLEIVDRAKIILKDQGMGEIRLIIKPEALGEVKIRLNLEEGHLAGQIIVENNTVKDVFQNNMASLLDSFREGGFTGLDIQVSVGDGGQKGQEFRDRAALLDSYSQGGAFVRDEAVASVTPVQRSWWDTGQLNLVV